MKKLILFLAILIVGSFLVRDTKADSDPYAGVHMQPGVLYLNGSPVDFVLQSRGGLIYAKKPRGRITVYDHGPKKVVLTENAWNPPLKNFAFTTSGSAIGATITGLRANIAPRQKSCFDARAENGALDLFWYADQGLFGMQSTNEVFDMSEFPEDYRPRAKRLITLSANHVIPGDPCSARLTIRASDIIFSGSTQADANDLFVNAQFK